MPELPEAWADLSRAEGFELQPRTPGPSSRGFLSLERQQFNRQLLRSDPGVKFAVKAWLVARGSRHLHLVDEHGAVVEHRPFALEELSDPLLARPPEKLISLCPSNAEVIESLGCFDRVIACEDSTDWPEAAQNVPRLGPDLGPDLDRVSTLSPELVLSSLSVPGMERIVTGLRVRQVPQLVLAPRSFDDVKHEIGLTGRYLAVAGRAQEVCGQLDRERDELIARRGRFFRPLRVYLEWWPRPMYTPGGDCYSNELIRFAGGINVFRARTGSSVEVSPEQLVAVKPHICFLSWCGVHVDKLDIDNLLRRPGLQRLEAIQERRVFKLDERYAGRPGPRMLEAARIMARAIDRVRKLLSLEETDRRSRW
ncbi:MAG: ABC transporter substrate-binding protein, partial [Nannocystaceae bacterium]